MGDYFILAALVTKEKMVKELACEVSEIFMILKYYIKKRWLHCGKGEGTMSLVESQKTMQATTSYTCIP